MIRDFIKILLISSLLWPLSIWAADQGDMENVEVIKVTDLQQLGQESLERNLPIVMMLSADGCSWCLKLEEEHFKPMLRSGEYENKALIRQFKIDDGLLVRDFDGQMVSPDEINGRYGAFVTPTIIYLDGNGSELAKKMVGMGTSHYFGSYLDVAIDESLDKLHRTTPLRAKLAKLSAQ
ncbi:MAG: hypothetical protein OQK13_02005 [Gammaproteobacteria bacterium]|nr:hypothetical protein [Gammaproteobacteria bacterium]